MTKKLKNPVLPRGLGRKLKKEALENMTIPTKRFQFHAEIKAHSKGKDGESDGLFIEGYASTSDLDRQGEVVEPGAFADSLKEYMDNPVMTFMHNWADPIGRAVEARIDEKGLWIRGFISSAAGKVIKLIEDGVLRALSIGYEVVDEAEKSGVYIISKLKLFEIAVVSIPANQRALFSIAKGLERGTDLELTGDEMRRQIKESPEIRQEIRLELRAEMKNEEMWARAWDAMSAACELQIRENELLDGVEEVIEEVRTLVENDAI